MDYLNKSRKCILTNSQKAIIIYTKESHKCDWKGGLNANRVYDDCR